MIASLVQPVRNDLELPSSAPQVRITAGLGTAGQKTWNLRRPITLLGSRRPSHIVLRDQLISKSHCVIVNTGSEVLLKDLHTSGGTICNGKPVDLAVLSDGDVMVVGGTKIQVAIRVPEGEKDDSASGRKFVEPMKFAKTVRVNLCHADTVWEQSSAIALIGRHEQADIMVHHDQISPRHAVLFKFLDGAGIFDLDSASGVTVNGVQVEQSNLLSGDRLGIGPFTIALVWDESAEMDEALEVPLPPMTSDDVTDEVDDAVGELDFLSAGVEDEMPSTEMMQSSMHGEAQQESLGEIGSQLNKLEGDITESWQRLNSWEAKLQDDAQKITRQDADLTTRVLELDAKDAQLRGQLHDLGQYQEQLLKREQELMSQLAIMQQQQDEVMSAAAEQDQQKKLNEQRAQELQRREHVYAQRWTKLKTMCCPHCGKPVRSGGSNI